MKRGTTVRNLGHASGRARLLAGSAALALSLPQGAIAQPLLLDDAPQYLGQIVVTAAGFEQAVADAPASISVITREDLERGTFRDLTDALREVQGVVTTGVANEQDIQIRGLPGSYTLILVDGRRQGTRESRPNGSAGFEQSFVPPLNMIERIEVVRGPMSSLYGSDAMGGVINIITRRAGAVWSGSLTTEGTLQAHARSGNSAQTSFHLGGPLVQERLNLQFWGRLQRRNEDRLVGGIQGAREHNLGARLTFTPTDTQEIRLEAGSSRVRRDSTTGRSVIGTGSDSFAVHERQYWSLGHTGRWGAASTELSIQQEWGERTNFSRTASGAFEAALRTPRIRNTTVDGQLTLPFDFYGQHTMVTGFQFRNAHLTDHGHLGSDQTMSLNNWALFAENEWRLNDSVSLTGGLRMDQHEVYGRHFSPRLYAVWHATPELTFKGGVSTGFRAPDIRSIAPGYYMATQQGAGWLAPNPDLRPERSTSFEFSTIWEGSNGLSASATAFYTEFRDKISNINTQTLINPETGDIIDPLGGAACNAGALAPYPGYRCLWQSFNIDDAVIRGLELSARWEATDALTLRGSYTLTDSEQRSGAYAGFPLQRTPRHRASLRADWVTPVDGLDLWAVATYHGAEINAGPRIGGNGTPVVINGVEGRRYGSYGTVDLGLTYQLNPSVTVNAAVYNVFDRVIDQQENNNVGEGRRLWLGVSSQF